MNTKIAAILVMAVVGALLGGCASAPLKIPPQPVVSSSMKADLAKQNFLDHTFYVEPPVNKDGTLNWKFYTVQKLSYPGGVKQLDKDYAGTPKVFPFEKYFGTTQTPSPQLVAAANEFYQAFLDELHGIKGNWAKVVTHPCPECLEVTFSFTEMSHMNFWTSMYLGANIRVSSAGHPILQTPDFQGSGVRGLLEMAGVSSKLLLLDYRVYHETADEGIDWMHGIWKQTIGEHSEQQP